MVRTRVVIAAIALAGLALAACNGGANSGREPTGTPTDPVKVCKRVGDVCTMEEGGLGVCVETAHPTRYTCASQH